MPTSKKKLTLLTMFFDPLVFARFDLFVRQEIAGITVLSVYVNSFSFNGFVVFT